MPHYGAYDYDSVMHYPAIIPSIAVNPSQPIMTALWPNQGKQSTMGSALGLSPGDVLGLQTAYGIIRNTLVSIDYWGRPGGAEYPSMSEDGRYVAFAGRNLVPEVTNSFGDIYVRDRNTATTVLVSVSSSGGGGNARSQNPTISGNGRYVVFESDATNLLSVPTSFDDQIYVHDLQTRNTTVVSVDVAGNPSRGTSLWPSISSDGRHVAFWSTSRLSAVNNYNNLDADVYVRDLQTSVTTRVSVSPFGSEGNGNSTSCAISGDGRYVAFTSRATNLVVGGIGPQVYVRDLQTQTTTMASVYFGGGTGNPGLIDPIPSISADGPLRPRSTTAVLSCRRTRTVREMYTCATCRRAELPGVSVQFCRLRGDRRFAAPLHFVRWAVRGIWGARALSCRVGAAPSFFTIGRRPWDLRREHDGVRQPDGACRDRPLVAGRLPRTGMSSSADLSAG